MAARTARPPRPAATRAGASRERAARDRVAAAHHELGWLQPQLVETREAQLLQIGAVHRATDGWALPVCPDGWALPVCPDADADDLARFAATAGIDIA